MQSSVGFSGNENEVDLERLRARLRKSSDAELQRDIRAGESMCSPYANFGKPPRQVFVIQLGEARTEWLRRKENRLSTPVCTEHKTEMAFPTSIDLGNKVILRGKEIRNQFHYCGTNGCMWRYSSELGEYFRATEFPASHPLPGKLKL